MSTWNDKYSKKGVINVKHCPAIECISPINMKRNKENTTILVFSYTHLLHQAMWKAKRNMISDPWISLPVNKKINCRPLTWVLLHKEFLVSERRPTVRKLNLALKMSKQIVQRSNAIFGLTQYRSTAWATNQTIQAMPASLIHFKCQDRMSTSILKWWQYTLVFVPQKKIKTDK